MRSFSVWCSAERPNYNTNIDLRFPYSELINYNADSDIHVEKIRFENLIQHVDYWGEGKVVCGDGIRGFSNCYNVNERFQLVGSGPDVDRKIPNRIPVTNDEDCDTSDFIEDNSVLTVTVAGASHVTSSCAKDIARVVNKDRGKVVVYGVQGDSQEIAELTAELGKIGLTPSANATLPDELQGLTYYDTHVAFLTSQILRKTMEDELYNNIVEGYYDTAVNKAISYRVAKRDEPINEVVTRLISAAPRKVMSFAYKLWYGGAQDIVRNHFPKTFEHIFNEDAVTIVNKKYEQPMKIDIKTGITGWGDSKRELTIKTVSWKFHPAWSSDGVTFKLYNIHSKSYILMSFHSYKLGDRYTVAHFSGADIRNKFYLEPMVENGNLVFFIISCEFGQALKMDVDMNSIGDRLVLGHNGSVYNEYELFRWIIAAW